MWRSKRNSETTSCRKYWKWPGNINPLWVIAERIFPALKETLQETLRENKIGYLDTAGNIYVNTPEQFVWLDGHKATETKKPVTNRAFTKTGLKAVFYLLLHQDKINLLAKATNVALGNINNIITGLKEAGFILPINHKEVQLQNKKALLDRWIAGYLKARAAFREF